MAKLLTNKEKDWKKKLQIDQLTRIFPQNMKLHVASIKIVNGKPQIYALSLIFLEDNRQIHTCRVMEKMLTNIAN